VSTPEDFGERVREAAARGARLRIRGSGSKDFYGQSLEGELLELSAWRGVVAYEPTELFITARAGTPLAEIEAALAARGQMLASEPPQFGGGATVGGAVAAGLSGPRRLAAGALRDFVLGVQMIDGEGRVGRFGGQVMKNVAGYDVSRLLCGSLGTLGAILEVTLKLLPRPAASVSVRLDCTQAEALQRLGAWRVRGLPIGASAWHDGLLTLRLEGAAPAVATARSALGGEELAKAEDFWRSLRDHSHPFLAAPGALWRLSLPATTPPLASIDAPLIEWAGTLRWARGDGERLRALAAAAGGHATLFRGSAADKAALPVFQPLSAATLALHQRVKHALDPRGVFGRGRLYAEL
jgi:glycolate oxidase FAD binding subunit